MKRKGYKRSKRGGAGRFVQLPEWVQASEAWSTMKPGPRALYIELKRRYKGSNNGEITLSHREAAHVLNVNRNTVGPYFRDLQERGFIEVRQGHCLGPSGIGQTAHWELTELPSQTGTLAKVTFMRWRQNQKPRTKTRTPGHEN